MNLLAQKIRFEQLWNRNKLLFGTQKWEASPDFVFFVEIPLPETLWEEMKIIQEELKRLLHTGQGFWIPVEKMHITLALPARNGEHFQGNDKPHMQNILTQIAEKISPFSLSLGDINCFPDAVFREVYDSQGTLYDLHEAITQNIPFAQKPLFSQKNYIPHVSFFYGEFHAHPEFEAFFRSQKKVSFSPEKIIFGRARNEKGEYDRRILKEFSFSQK